MREERVTILELIEISKEAKGGSRYDFTSNSRHDEPTSGPYTNRRSVPTYSVSWFHVW